MIGENKSGKYSRSKSIINDFGWKFQKTMTLEDQIVSASKMKWFFTNDNR